MDEITTTKRGILNALKELKHRMVTMSVTESSRVGGLCALFQEITGGEDLEDVVSTVFGIDAFWDFWFIPTKQGVKFLGSRPNLEVWHEAKELYVSWKQDPFGDNPLGRARHLLVDHLLLIAEYDLYHIEG